MPGPAGGWVVRRVLIQHKSCLVLHRVTRQDCLQPGLNFMYLDATTLVDAGDESVPGDWIIRATVMPEVILLNGFE